jgi:hypothetical protein
MARIEWVDHRLKNWALWHERMNSGGMGYAAQSVLLSERVDCNGRPEAWIPVDEVDAEITNQAVESLKLGHGHLYQTLRLLYLKGAGIEGTARTMRRAVSTIYTQLARADELLAFWFRERAQRRRQAAPVDLSVPLLSDAARLALLAQLAEERRALQARRPVPFVGPPRPPTKRARPTLRLKLSSFPP